MVVAVVQSFSHIWLFAEPVDCNTAGFLSSPPPRACSDSLFIDSVMPSNYLIFCFLFSCLQSFPASRSFPMSQLFASCDQYIETSASASALPMNTQDWFPLGLTGLISFSRRYSQESSPKPQFQSINSLALSLLYGATLTSIHNYWKNSSFDYMDHCWQSNASAF